MMVGPAPTIPAGPTVCSDIQRIPVSITEQVGMCHDGRPRSVRATAVGRDAERNAVLAGDPKGLDYYVILL